MELTGEKIHTASTPFYSNPRKFKNIKTWFLNIQHTKWLDYLQ
jgi:hypothetical protein